MTGTVCSALAGAPIPEAGGAPIQSLAPVVSRITPGVVGISVRGRVREDNPLLQDPLFRRAAQALRRARTPSEVFAYAGASAPTASAPTVPAKPKSPPQRKPASYHGPVRRH